MPKLYLNAHGIRYSGSGFISAPKDVRVHYIAESLELSMLPNSLAMINSGGEPLGMKEKDIEEREAGPKRKSDNREMIPNYALSPLADLDIAISAASVSSVTDGDVYYIVKPSFGRRLSDPSLKCLFTHTSLRLSDVFSWLAENRSDVTHLYLLICRGESRSEFMPTGKSGWTPSHFPTIALGTEEPRPEDNIRLNPTGDEDWPADIFHKDDDRYLPTLHAKRSAVNAKLASDNAGGLQEFDHLPQGTKAALRAANTFSERHWEHAQRDRPFDSPPTPQGIWDPGVPAPRNVNEAWPVKDWRDAFYLFLEGRYGSKLPSAGLAKANLNLWLMVSKWLTPSENIIGFGDAGETELTAESVTDSEIIAYARGERGLVATGAQNTVAFIEYQSGRLARLAVAAALSGTGDFYTHLASLADEDLWYLTRGIYEWMQNNDDQEIRVWAQSNPPGSDAPSWLGSAYFILGDTSEPEYWRIIDHLIVYAAADSRELQSTYVTHLQNALCSDLQEPWQAFIDLRQEILSKTT